MSKDYDTWEVYKYDQTDNPKVTSNELAITVYFDRKVDISSALAEIEPILKENNIISIVSDAGTPSISDPGSILIKEMTVAGN